MPALTFTSPTPETLQSVVFSDSSEPNAHEYERRSTNPSLPSIGRSFSSGSLPPNPSSHDTQVQFEVRDFLTVPVKEEGKERHSADAKMECSKSKPRILSRAWDRLSRILVPRQRVSAQAADTVATKSAREGPRLWNGNRSKSGRGMIDEHGVGARKSNGTVDEIDPRRHSFGIPTLARRRLAKRRNNLKRYSVPF